MPEKVGLILRSLIPQTLAIKGFIILEKALHRKGRNIYTGLNGWCP
jgi:hypothetical protein